MNNVTMAGMNAMGAVGGGMPGARQPMTGNENARSQLNTYIYEYFLRNEMWDCARSLLNSDQTININKDSPGRRRENGADEGGDGESKDDIDSKRPADLPEPQLPKDCPDSCFLYEWWCLFWDMFNAQRGKGDARNVLQYVHHTQSQSRMRQEQQQQMLRGLQQRGNMMPGQYEQMMMRQGQQPNGMPLNELRQKAIQNNRNTTPQQQMMMQQQQQKQQAMQRDPSDGNNQQRPQSPGSAENAPSPSKRPRLDGTPNFNPQQQMPNGRGQVAGMPQQVGDTGPSNALQAAHMQLTNGIEQNNLTAPQFQNIPGNPNAATQARLAGYQQNLQAQQAGQMGAVKPMPNQGGPQNQGSPMMNPGQDGGAIANYYNPGELGQNGMRGGQGGQPGGSGGNHALQDYQMQLMLLEQQNKKRLMMARQEQDNMLPRTDGQGGPAVGQNGQPFQGTSPQGGPRNSPNPGEMKRGTPHMNNAGMPSPLPEGQSRGSPSNGMNFNMSGGPMDPTMNPQFFNKMNGMDPNMVAGMGPNGMRPPTTHPGGAFNQMTPQQMMARQQQAAVQGQWQAGPNGQMMAQAGAQGPPQQNMGTPQPRNMPPPSVPAGGAATNGRATSSPQQNPAPPTPSQTNKANPNNKKKGEGSKADKKRPPKKGSNANLNAGATPVADPDASAATPTPATPITPHPPNSGFNGQKGAVQPVANGQPPAPNPNIMSQQQDSIGNFMNDGAFDAFNSGGMEFATVGNDVLQDFDFDSFLHQDDAAENGGFNFDTFAGIDGNEIGAE